MQMHEEFEKTGRTMPRKIAAMQPYLFPYLGYFQLIAASDAFVLGDDLQYVKESWINRNRIIVSGQEKIFTFPMKKSCHKAQINEKVFADNFKDEIESLLQKITISYRRAPSFSQVFPLLEHILRNDECNLASYAEHTVVAICAFLGIETPIHIASRLGIGECVDKQDRVVRTVRKLGGSVYINPIGGVKLYDRDYFVKNGIDLRFHKMNDIRYKQFGNRFFPCLSIIDVLMFNGCSGVREMLCMCEISSGDEMRPGLLQIGPVDFAEAEITVQSDARSTL